MSLQKYLDFIRRTFTLNVKAGLDSTITQISKHTLFLNEHVKHAIFPSDSRSFASASSLKW